MIVNRRTALLAQTSQRIMRAAGRASSPQGQQAIVQRMVQRKAASLGVETRAIPASHRLQA